MGFGAWNSCLYHGVITPLHANGAGCIALLATDALRFAYTQLILMMPAKRVKAQRHKVPGPDWIIRR